MTSPANDWIFDLHVSGDMYQGDPQVHVLVDGKQVGGVYDITAHHSQGQSQDIQIDANVDPTKAHQIQVLYANDAWDGTATTDGHDRNVYVSSLSANGQTINGSLATNTATNGAIADTNPHEAVMDVNGMLTFNVAAASAATPTPAPSSAPSSGSSSQGLTLHVSGDMYNGDPLLHVLVDGKQVGGTYDVTAHHSLGQSQDIAIAGTFDPNVAHQVQLQFVNDGWDGQHTGVDGDDRNVYVSGLTLNGHQINGSAGTGTADNGAIKADANGAVMDVNGSLTFNVAAGSGSGSSTPSPAPTPTPGSGGTIGSGSDTLVVNLSEDAYQGNAQFNVAVDGHQLNTTPLSVTALHSSGSSEAFTFDGNFGSGSHDVAVTFLNDLYAGTPATDRNLYVDGITFDGQHVADSTATLLSSGTVHIDPASPSPAPAPSPAPSSTPVSSPSPAPSSTPAPAPSGPGFFVSATGSDSNAGTLASPFATLAHAQQAMENSSVKTTYVEGGTYHLSHTLDLTGADSGETWSYYAPNGVDSAVLDGGGAIDLINIAGGSHITIDGLKLQHFNAYGIHSEGGPSLGQAVTTGNTFENNDIGFNTVTSWSSGGIFAEGASPNTTIVNNYVHDLGSFGISVTSWFAAGDSIDGSVIAHNVVTNTVERMSDGGAIYVGMHGGYQAPANGVQILDNFVSQTGAPGVGGVAGIYLDDNANDVLVSGNVIGPNNAGSGNASRADSEAFEIHNGHDNHITGNIVDLGSTGKEQTTFYFQDGGSFKGMSGNSFTGNVVVSDFSGSAHTSSGFAYAEFNGVSSDYTIQNNLYFNYGGGQVLTNGQLASDGSPVMTNPELSGSTYTLASGSPAFSTLHFQPIVGGWGPQGFVVPSNLPSSV